MRNWLPRATMTAPVLMLAAAACGGDTGPVDLPAPAITSLVPATAVSGGSSLSLTVNGSGFAAASSVRFDGASRPTTFVSASVLTVTLGAADLATAGGHEIVVTNPEPNGGSSSPALFSVENPVPVIDSLIPNPRVPTDSAASFTIRGSRFVASSEARLTWATGSGPRTTTLVAPGELRVELQPLDLANPGPRQVTVFNPQPGGGTSNATTFNVNNPVPAISSLSPDSTTTGSGSTHPDSLGDLVVTIDGTGFQWSGFPDRRSIVSLGPGAGAFQWTVESDRRIRLVLPYGTAGVAGTYPVTVTNTAPGGGTSAPAALTIVPACTVLAANVPYDPAGIGFARYRPVLDATHVYWYDGAIRRVAKQGGVVQTLASPSGGVNDLAVDDTHVYWTEQDWGSGAGSINSVPKDGGQVAVLASGVPAGSSFDVFTPGGLTFDATYVYWGEETGGGAIRRVPKAGGTVVDIGRGEAAVRWLTLDAAQQYFYFYGGSNFYRRLRAGGPLDTLALNAGSNIVGGIALDESFVYWVEVRSPGRVVRVPIGGGAPGYPVTNLNNPHTVAVDPTYLYYGFSSGPGLAAVFRMPKTGGPPSPMPYCFHQGVSGPIWIAADEAWVYFFGQSTANDNLAVLVRQPKAGR